jgi:hypothetical protein
MSAMNHAVGKVGEISGGHKLQTVQNFGLLAVPETAHHHFSSTLFRLSGTKTS